MTGSYLTDVYDPADLYLTDLRESDGIHRMDVRDLAQVMDTFSKVRPSLAIHLAAETNVDLCEKDPNHAYRSNYIGTMNIALACAEYDVEMAYVSTAGVFRGNQSAPYTEFDIPGPINHYAGSKFQGEGVVQQLLNKFYIARAGWMFGGSCEDKKFVGKIAQQCLDQAPAPRLKAVADKKGSPTFARDFLFQLRTLMESGRYGLYHLVNHGEATRYDVAVEIMNFLQLDGEVDQVSSDSFPLPARRPDSESACNYKLQLQGLDRMRDWKEALRDYLETWRQDLSAPAARTQAAGR
jgi:dTDP-4-dehydrorhamnose reductase